MGADGDWTKAGQTAGQGRADRSGAAPTGFLVCETASGKLPLAPAISVLAKACHPGFTGPASFMAQLCGRVTGDPQGSGASAPSDWME